MRYVSGLVYIAIALLPLGNLVRFDVGTGVALLPLDIAVGLAALFSLPHLIRRRNVVWADTAFRYAAAFVGIGLFSLLMHARWLSPFTFLVSLLYMARFVAYAQLMWSVRELAQKTQDRLLLLLGVSGIISVIAGFAQLVLYPDLRNLYYAGWDEHVYRIFGTLLDPNFSGAFFMCVVAVIWLLHARRLLYTQVHKLIVWISTLIVSACALTYSRGSYVALAVFGSSIALLQRSRKIVLIASLLFFAIVGLLSMDRSYESTNLFRTASIESRITEYQQALTIFQDSPLIGIGFNAYRYAQLRHGFLDFDTWQRDHAGAGVPNSWLFVLATTGLLGLGAYVGMWWQIVRKLYTSRNVIVFSLLMGLFAHAIFENTLFYPHLMVVIFLVVGASQKEMHVRDTHS